MVSSLRDDDPSAAWDGDSRLKPRCSCYGQTAGGGRVGTGDQYSARTRPYFVGHPNSILPDPGTAMWYIAPTRGLDLAAPQTLFQTAVTSALIAVMTGINFGVYPARRAAMLDTVEDLRNE